MSLQRGRITGEEAKDAPPWKPVLNPGVDLRGLPLTPEEGFIASRLDGATDLHGLSLITGLSPERIETALERLIALGAVSRPEDLDEGQPVAREENGGAHRDPYETPLPPPAPAGRAARAKTAPEPGPSPPPLHPLPPRIHPPPRTPPLP